MVGFRRASGVLLVVLVVMATTIVNGTPVVDKAKDAAESVGDKVSEAATTVGDKAKDAAASVGVKVPGAKAGGASLDVKASGAKGDGKTDDSAAFAAAWKEACAAGSTITVPKGEYLVESLEFKGPCKGPVTLELNGNLKAPATVKTSKPHSGWIDFENIADFTLNGNGAIFDGQGSLAWKANDCAKTGKCNSLPINIRFTGLTNSKIKSITSTNSKLFHMNILNCKNITLEDIGIDAPPESLNTDGIHIGRSNGVNLLGAKIKTGDDCVSIGDGTENLIVENVECGPGHGISIGSLGRYPNEQPVKGVTVRKCLIKNTDNGVRIKTWPGSPPGIASNILFEDITMDNVSTPVLIDQEYCPYGHCKAGVPSKVKLSDVTIKNIKGTSATKVAVKLMCSKGVPCTNIALADINLVHNGKEGPAVSACSNIKPILSGKLVPAACTEVAKTGP
ncbi:exopolygalacturonase clone GBGA483 [Arabidopsis lyrata subsp. lyrata]|uniref:exopolygalacturonase clone GBGA483 n=1 Tax=Arabidopsis lyrata subsp. lyrata TaxID=81972 RepID=UPI000A29B80F|nr:exopolygalacturonase clone GBGA483 [Arabidopsis lyrata subsp. lyrata]|eukprot:XP_020871509.1 exopolygalacturonase clone GBGA483 [Arabidopsis lyrata subsp. lyrata]